jgi:hypothetical protein
MNVYQQCDKCGTTVLLPRTSCEIIFGGFCFSIFLCSDCRGRLEAEAENAANLAVKVKDP